MASPVGALGSLAPLVRGVVAADGKPAHRASASARASPQRWRDPRSEAVNFHQYFLILHASITWLPRAKISGLEAPKLERDIAFFRSGETGPAPASQVVSDSPTAIVLP